MGSGTQPLSQITFSWYDYTLFGISLVLSVLIGVYFGFVKKQSTMDEYLLGGKEMKTLPIAFSLIASCVSTILCVPTDVYRYGITCAFGTITSIFAIVISNYIYVPVFYKLQLTSIYEYFELRFDTTTRKFSSFLYILSLVLYLPIVIYAPALALAQVTGLNMNIMSPLICGICIFYTTIGGLKAVVWTDTLQFVFIIAAVVAAFLMGIGGAGGIDVVWQKSSDNGRLDIDFDFDITKRDTIWTGTIGMTIMHVVFIGSDQGFIQKCMALPTYKAVKQVLCIFAIGIAIIFLLCGCTGLVISAKYSDCDPITTGVISHPDQLLPHYIMDVAQGAPGLPGLFIAGVFNAALSTLSGTLNCVSGVIYKDFIAGFFKKDIPEESVGLILKLIVVIIGILSASLVFVVEHLGSILALTFSLPSIAMGPTLGMFTVGMFLPVVNSKGVMCGGVTSLLVMAWIVFGFQWYNGLGLFNYPTLQLSVDGCKNMTYSDLNQFNTTRVESEAFEPLFVYKISFYYYYLIGMLVVLLVSYPVSLATHNKKTIVKRDCIVPFMQFLIRN